MIPINTIRLLEDLANYNYTALPYTDFTPNEVTNWLNTVLDLLENNFEKPEIFAFSLKFSAKLITSINCVKKFNTITISNLADKCLATITKLNSIVQKRMDFDPKWIYDHILLVHSSKITSCDTLPDKECFKKDGNAIFITLKQDNIILSILDDRNKVRRIQLSIAQACNPSEIPNIRSRLEQALEEIKLRQYVRTIEPGFYIHIIIEPSRSIFNHPYVWHVKIVNGKVIPVSPRHFFPRHEYTVKEFLEYYSSNYDDRKINNLKELVKKHVQCNSEPKVTSIFPKLYQIQFEHNLINATISHLFYLNFATNDSIKSFTSWFHERIVNRFKELPHYKPGQSVSPKDFSSDRICVLTISSAEDEPVEITLHTKNKQGEIESEVLYSNGSFIDDALNKFTLLKSIQVVQKEFPHIPILHGINLPEEGEVKVGYDKYCAKVWYRSVTGNIVSQRIYYANPSDAENMPINATIIENEIRTACGCIQTQALIKDLNTELQENWFYEDPVCLNEAYLKTFDPQKRGDNDPLLRFQYDYTERKTARKKHTLGISYEPEKGYAIHKEGNSFPLPAPQKQYALDLLQGSQIWTQLRWKYGSKNIFAGSEILLPNKFLCIVKIDEVDIHFYDSHKNRNSFTFSHDSLPKIEGLELFLRRIEFLRNYLNQPGAIQFVQPTPSDKHLQGLFVQPYGETIKIIYAIPGTHHFHTAECDLDTFIEILQITDQKYRAELHAYHSVLIQKYGKERLNTTGKPIFKHTATLLPHTHSLKLNYLDYRGAEKTYDFESLEILDRDRIDTIDKFTRYMVEFIATPAGCDFCKHHDISMKYIKDNLSLIRVEKKFGPSHSNESRHPLDAIDKILPEKLKEFIELRDEIAFAVKTKFGAKVGSKPYAVPPGKYTITPNMDGFDIHYIDYRKKQSSRSLNLDTPNEKIDRFIQIQTILSHFDLFPVETLQPSLDPNEGRIGFSYNFDLTVIKIRYYDFHIKEFVQIDSSGDQLEDKMQCIVNQQRGFPGYLRDKYKTEHVITEGKFTLDPEMYGLKVKKGKVECHFLDPKGEERIVSFNINELPEKEKLDAILKCSLVLNSYSTQPDSIPFSYYEKLDPWCIDIREHLVEGIFVRSTADYTQLDIQYIDPATNNTVHHIVDPEHFVVTLKEVQDTYSMLLTFSDLDTSPEIRAKTFVQAAVPPFQAGHPPNYLETLFKEINFEDEKHPCYMNPRANTECGNVVHSKVLHAQLLKFIRIVNDGGDLSVQNGHYYGISDDPAQKLKYYTDLRAYLSNIVMKLKEPSVPIDRKNDIVVSFAIAGRHCGGRWMGESMQHYNELFGLAGETIEAIILSMVDRFKISIIEEMDNKEGQPNVHKYLAICRALKQHGLGIPAAAGAEYDHYGENALIGSSFPNAEAVRKGFMDRFTVANVVAWIHEQANHEIKAKNINFNGLLQEKMYNMVHDRMHANEPEKIAHIERKFQHMEEEQAKAERRSAVRALIDTEMCDTCLIYNDRAELVRVTRKGIVDLMIHAGMLLRT